MSKSYSIEEIKQALALKEYIEALFNDKVDLPEVDMDKVHENKISPERLQALKVEISGSTERMYKKVVAMERLQELVIDEHDRIQIRKESGKFKVFLSREGYLPHNHGEGDTVSEAILNIKIDKGESSA